MAATRSRRSRRSGVPMWVADRPRQAHAEAQVLLVAERLLNREASSVEFHDLGSLALAQARREAPRFLHLARVHNDDGRNFSARTCHTCLADHRRATVRGHPVSSWLPPPFGGFDLDAAAESDDEVPAERLQEPVELLITEPTISEQRDLHVGRETGMQPLDQPVLVIVTLPFEGRFAHRHPDQRRCPPVTRDEVPRERRVIIGIELSPVERYDDLLATANDKLRPRMEQQPDVDAGVANHPIGLLHPMLLVVVGRMRVAATDRMDGEHGSIQCADDAVRERQHTACVKVILENLLDRLGNLERVLHEKRHRAAAHHAAGTDARSPKFLLKRKIFRNDFDHLRQQNGGIHQ